MRVDKLQVRIETPTGENIPGRGFYQRDEESLYVQIGQFDPAHRFFSFLDGDPVRLDLDKEGRLVFIEVAVPRRAWRVESGLVPPLAVLPRDVRWLDFRGRIGLPVVSTNLERSIVKLVLSQEPPAQTIALADSVLLEISAEQTAVAIWVTEIVDDLAGREIAAYRRRGRTLGLVAAAL
ncbi:MAG: hypothetical protein AB1644_03110 [Candidatus Zixiibacteriota bacterium]